jgi:hypothetical protein
MDKIHGWGCAFLNVFAQSTLELFVAEVGGGFTEAFEGGDVAVKDVDSGEFAFSIWLTRSMVALIAGATSRWVRPRAGGHGPGDEPDVPRSTSS